MRSTNIFLYFLSLALLALALPQAGCVTATSTQPTSTSPSATAKPDLRFWSVVFSAMWAQKSIQESSVPASSTEQAATTTTTYTPGGGTVYRTTIVTSYVDPPRPTLTKVVFVTATPVARREEKVPALASMGIATSTVTATLTLESHPASLGRRRNLRPHPTSLPSPGDLYLCTDINFGGKCTYVHSTTYKCHNMPPDLIKNVSSIRPDKGQRCNFFTKWDCEQLDAPWIHVLRWPGAPDLRHYALDDAVLSWECWEDDCNGVHGEGGCYENADGTPKDSLE